MRFTLSAIFFILFATLAIEAAPSKGKKGLRIPFKKRLRQRSIGSYLDSKRTSGFGRRQTASMELRNFHEVSWIGEVSFGTPPRSFEVVFDTGGGDSWLADLTCGEPCDDAGITLYDGGASESFRDLNVDFQVQYSDGDVVAGRWTSDNIRFGDDPEQTVQILDQDFGRANVVPESILTEEASGVIGLGYQHSVDIIPTVIDNLFNQDLIDDAVFSCRFIKDVFLEAGELYLGYVPTEHVDGDIQYTNIIRTPDGKANWVIPVADVLVGGNPLGKSANALMDTGSSGIVVTPDVAKSIYDGVEGAELGPNGWVLPGPYPADVAFTIGQRTFSIPAEDMVTGKSVGDKFAGAVQQDDDGVWIIGDTFIKNHFLVFDFGLEAIGIGNRNDYNE